MIKIVRTGDAHDKNLMTTDTTRCLHQLFISVSSHASPVQTAFSMAVRTGDRSLHGHWDSSIILFNRFFLYIFRYAISRPSFSIRGGAYGEKLFRELNTA
jgi:hypothetical protein